jgi:HTH-type transcriptional regulator/antitoxin HigA
MISPGHAPHVLHNVKDYNVTLNEIHRLLELNPVKGSREYDTLELLSVLVEDYETRNIPEPALPTPQSAVEFMLEQKGLTKSDLIKPLGGKSRVSEFFARKRPLSTNQIRALRELLGIPADLLLDDLKDSTAPKESGSSSAYKAKRRRPMLVADAVRKKAPRKR